MQIIIDQDPNDPKKFIPICEKAKMVAKFLYMQHFTIEDLNNIKSIPIEFLIHYEDHPIGGRFKLHTEHATWFDKKIKRYFGRKLDKKGYLNTHNYALGKTENEVYEKLFKIGDEE